MTAESETEQQSSMNETASTPIDVQRVTRVDYEKDGERHVVIRLMSEHGEALGGELDVRVDIDQAQLQQLVNSLLREQHEANQAKRRRTDGELENFEEVPCEFYVDEEAIRTTLANALTTVANNRVEYSLERTISVVYEPQAVFRVYPVTRCTSSLPGHAEPVITVQFSPDARFLASGSGDCTVRLWDLATELPIHTCEGHKAYILVVQFAPDGNKLASACKNGQIRIWDPTSGKAIGQTLSGHKQWITSLAWQPLHENGECRLLASAGKDGTIRIWDTTLYKCERILSGHTACVSCLKWGGQGLIYSASQDRTIKVWRVRDGVLCRTLQGHGHWVNTMALSTDYVLRIGAFDPKQATNVPTSQIEGLSKEEIRARALKRYNSVMGTEKVERLVSGSDDFTMFLWRPSDDKKPIARMTGHMQLVNQVAFSCDGRLIASASFDKSIKVWDGRTGVYMTTLRGHVQAVYQIAFAPDSRLLVSGSKDSTLKVWNLAKITDKTNTMPVSDLPGHGDEVYTVDWSPDGQRVCSGGKDKLLRIWRR